MTKARTHRTQRTHKLSGAFNWAKETEYLGKSGPVHLGGGDMEKKVQIYREMLHSTRWNRELNNYKSGECSVRRSHPSEHLQFQAF